MIVPPLASILDVNLTTAHLCESLISSLTYSQGLTVHKRTLLMAISTYGKEGLLGKNHKLLKFSFDTKFLT